MAFRTIPSLNSTYSTEHALFEQAPGKWTFPTMDEARYVEIRLTKYRNHLRKLMEDIEEFGTPYDKFRIRREDLTIIIEPQPTLPPKEPL